jgi:hypothetical protein
MNLASRAELVKGQIFKDFRTSIGFPRYKLIEYICRTGVSERSSVIQKVIWYMKKNDHLVIKDNGLYFIRYRRKDKANPRGVVPSVTDFVHDIKHSIRSFNYSDMSDGHISDVLIKSFAMDLKSIIERLREKGSCTIKFERVG